MRTVYCGAKPASSWGPSSQPKGRSRPDQGTLLRGKKKGPHAREHKPADGASAVSMRGPPRGRLDGRGHLATGPAAPASAAEDYLWSGPGVGIRAESKPNADSAAFGLPAATGILSHGAQKTQDAAAGIQAEADAGRNPSGRSTWGGSASTIKRPWTQGRPTHSEQTTLSLPEEDASCRPRRFPSTPLSFGAVRARSRSIHPYRVPKHLGARCFPPLEMQLQDCELLASCR